ncbi:hypothetical protein CC86DRAFT_463609 [Ophiobolus disseminans]|uniref:Uncharacterized protein n=1 Tax=Ophiobolus disseminans TaxID=1469910 RepID=A0A6A7AFZ3_9PLEO|nr:hypothetical protein CC86DRAFT_463609 [Ophiobolus disseminans]
MQGESAFAYIALYSVLVCRKHGCAIYGLDEHLKRHHHMSAAERRALLAAYKDCNVLPPAEVTQPMPCSAPIDELGPAQDAFLCSSSSGGGGGSAACGFISTSRAKMQQHVNQQHHTKLTRWSSPTATLYRDHAAQLWRPVKVQTFFRKRRYICYFIVQEEEQEEQQQGEEQGEQQGREQGGQHESERQGGYQQRLALLSSTLGALKREDSKAIDRMAAEASAKDRTGWFKRTQ